MKLEVGKQRAVTRIAVTRIRQRDLQAVPLFYTGLRNPESMAVN